MIDRNFRRAWLKHNLLYAELYKKPSSTSAGAGP